MRFRVGVDTGGTFTDCVVIDEQGGIFSFKELSTPKDPSVGLYNVIGKAARHFGLSLPQFLPQLDFFAHGTTVATNTLLTATGAVTGLILTAGFRDTLEMCRAHKENIWDLYLPVPEPLVPRYLRLPVRERIDYRGQVVQSLDTQDVLEACGRFRNEGVSAVAVCTLFSFLNDSHEKQIRDILIREMPDAFISISSEVLPQIREYERMSTTVANTYVGPRLTVYLSNLEKKLRGDGLGRAFYVTASNGGVMTAETAIRQASATLLSGPAAGAVGAVYFAGLLQRENLILMDMGGTSFDVTLVSAGKVTLSTEGEIAGYRIAKPMIDINTIGAGGGSIAWMDKGGMLKVGPGSAGSDPGPVCYNLGGDKPTVTDANLLLGYLNKNYFLGGEMVVDEEKARAAIKREIADPLGMKETEAAAGIFQIINQNMADATKVVSVQRGHDPREYALVSAGGACSIHACKIAEEVGCRSVIVPRAASVFCALGMLESDIRLDNVRTFNALIPGIDLKAFNLAIQEVEDQSLKELVQEGVEQRRARLLRFLDVRYLGQHHEVTIEIPHGCTIQKKHLQEIAQTFHQAHERLYTYSTPESPLEIMNLRITAIAGISAADGVKKAGGAPPGGTPPGGALPDGPLPDGRQSGGVGEGAGSDPKESLKGHRPVYFVGGGGFQDTPVYDRDLLKPGMEIEGPAVIEERITTVIVHPGWSMWVDGYGNIVMEVTE
jgi:N-methylhydantoinase A